MSMFHQHLDHLNTLLFRLLLHAAIPFQLHRRFLSIYFHHGTKEERKNHRGKSSSSPFLQTCKLSMTRRMEPKKRRERKEMGEEIVDWGETAGNLRATLSVFLFTRCSPPVSHRKGCMYCWVSWKWHKAMLVSQENNRKRKGSQRKSIDHLKSSSSFSLDHCRPDGRGTRNDKSKNKSRGDNLRINEDVFPFHPFSLLLFLTPFSHIGWDFLNPFDKFSSKTICSYVQNLWHITWNPCHTRHLMNWILWIVRFSLLPLQNKTMEVTQLFQGNHIQYMYYLCCLKQPKIQNNSQNEVDIFG